jgi:hypothetical protein
MTNKDRTRMYQIRIAVAAALALSPILSYAAPTSVEARLEALEQRQSQLERQLAERDARIRQLEAQVQAPNAGAGDATASVVPTPVQAAPAAGGATAQSVITEDAAVAAGAAAAPVADPVPRESAWGTYEGGKGLVLARTSQGEVDFSAFTYLRYLNQRMLDDSYTDAFGRTKDIDIRDDLQLQKVMLFFKGWLFDPNFRYQFYTWTSNTSQGQGAQVVVAGNLSYRFNDAFSLAGGIGGLPSTRTTNYTFPNWLKVDHRTVADEFFRASYTTGVWAWGEVADGVRYRVMVGNNLSQLGVDAGKLDSGLNAYSGAVWWMPTTGEYGPGEGFGDFEHHTEFATLVGANFTHSREDAQSQPGVNDFWNSQIRLSDGTLIFQADPFGTGTQIQKATYQMAAVNAGFKYRGFSLDGEYYWRTLDDFRATGPLPRDSFVDDGFQLQASAMLLPQTLQAYVAGSKINGQYGDPWDVSIGANWFPFKRRELRFNSQFLYLDRSPVGNTATPFVVGGNGWVFSTDVMLSF